MPGWRSHNKTEDSKTLFQVIRHFLGLSEAEHSGNCQDQYDGNFQDIMMFVSSTLHTRLMSKTNYPVKTLHSLMTSRECRGTQGSLNAHCLRVALASQELKRT